MQVTVKHLEGGDHAARLNKSPDLCPICQKHVRTTFLAGALAHNRRLDAVFRCPNDACRGLFVASYMPAGDGGTHNLMKTSLPRFVEEHNFSLEIRDISPSFCKIYNQALTAEENGLDQICGPGYRKALEFLIKDFLVERVYPDNEAQRTKILGAFLQPVIQEHIQNPQIQKCAERAVWLGNDETHYLRKWGRARAYRSKKFDTYGRRLYRVGTSDPGLPHFDAKEIRQVTRYEGMR